MSIKTSVEVQCPAGCEPFEGEVWSVLRVDKEPELKERLLAGELNLLMCPHCNRYFINEQPLVYHDPPRELLAFIFPEFYKEEEDRWRSKMKADFDVLQRASPGEAIDYEPLVYFGLESFRSFLEQETNLEDEVDIARHLSGSLKLSIYPIRPSVARASHFPPFIPFEGDAQGDMKDKMVAGLKRLLKENEYLATYQTYLASLQSAQDRSVPPRRKEPAA